MRAQTPSIALLIFVQASRLVQVFFEDTLTRYSLITMRIDEDGLLPGFIVLMLESDLLHEDVSLGSIHVHLICKSPFHHFLLLLK